jgi:pimeloyl-ACP methyl ester carboxylesterase
MVTNAPPVAPPVPGGAGAPARGRHRLRRWFAGAALALLALFVASTTASVVYNAATDGRQRPASALYPGPYVTLDGVSIAYRTWGSRGSPVVLVHGFVESTFAWSKVAPLLARDHRVYALDLTGFGFSARQGPYTLDTWAHEVLAFVDAFHLRHPLLVGHSLGAAVVADAVRLRPGAARGIVLADGDALTVGGPPAWARGIATDPYFTSLVRIGSSSPWFVRRVLAAAYGPEHPPLTDALVQAWVRPFRVEGTEAALLAMAHDRTEGTPGLSRSQLGAVRAPAEVIWGAADSIDPLSSGRTAAHILGVPVHLLPGAGHLSMLIQPVAFARLVETFDASLPSR